MEPVNRLVGAEKVAGGEPWRLRVDPAGFDSAGDSQVTAAGCAVVDQPAMPGRIVADDDRA
jgi:hypothetical protein